MRIVASSLLVIAGCSFVYMLTLGSTRSGYVRQKPVTYKFEEPTDWANDSTVSYSKKNYCEYVYNQEEQ